ncbi:MAG: GAP family protein [Thermoleophilia bacterium]|nr:GAP family protein [Thermoleophilia bacterium]MDH4339346.1 GAP family protein [Thermoleophilia bacterium]MDH5280961.1 GAP family protein [Thermoleophilia bacterium]
MGNAIGEILPLAIGVAISPVPIIAVVLMLGTPRARANGPAFAVGWLAGLTIVGAIVLLLASGNAAEDDGSPATWASVLEFVFGVLLLLMAARIWRGRPKPGQEAEMPKWMQTIDGFSAGKSFGAGALLSGLNPKNLALTIAAATAIAQTGIPGGKQAVALAVFVVVGSLTILAPVAIYFLMGAKAKEILDDLKGFMQAHNAAIMAVLLLVLGAKLIGDAIAGF